MDQTIISHPQTHTPYGNNFLHCDGKLLLHCYMRKNKRSITPCIKCLIGVGLSQRKVCRLTNISICTLNRFLNQEYDKRCKLAALQWAFQNKEKQPSIGKKWLQNNKNHHRLRVANWRKRNPHKSAEYERKQLQNPKRRLAQNLRARMRDFFKGKSKPSCSRLIGCSWDHFVSHISSLFTDGMCMSNYGKWHLDHIHPLSLFDLNDPEQAKKAFHYTNIQPLWASDNIRKHNKTNYGL